MNNFRSENISCKPISTLNELLNWNEVRKSRRSYAVSKLDLTKSREVEEAPKVIVCHDMANNYHEDRLFQGSANIDSCYNFYHWQLIDLFIYFSHHMVTIPCESWINAAHCNGVRILGCFITEFNQGETIWDELVSSKDLIDRVIDVLVDITVFFGFDGWLLNIENAVERVDRLKYFVDRLTRQLKRIDPDLYRVIWYDSVTVDGDLKWQNELNRMNDVFFQLSDGIFLNYTWKKENLSISRENGGKRYRDVYVGIDVFGRGCLGDGGYNCNVALDEIKKHDLSVALFAPGWVYETQTRSDFFLNNERFWGLLSDYLKPRRLLNRLPIATTFCLGSGRSFFSAGNSPNLPEPSGWANLSLQSLLPVISNQSSNADWCFQDAFYAGNSLIVKASRQLTLFNVDIDLKPEEKLKIEYVFKDEGPQLENFAVFLRYQSSNEIDVKEITLGESNHEFELLSKIEALYGTTKWLKRTYEYTVKSPLVKLNSINAINKYTEESKNPVKLGFLNIYELTSENKDIVTVNRLNITWKSRIFTLEKRIYLGIELNWNRNETASYYNVFLDNNRNSSSDEANEIDPEFHYIGSTRNESFSICLKLLNDCLSLNPTLGSGLPPLCFSIVVQPVNENGADSKSLDLDLCSPNMVSDYLVTINEPKIVLKNSEDYSTTFFEKVLFDFESF